MLENPVYPSGTRRILQDMGACSENPDGAENQQERLLRIGWVTGFVDGEGCFSVGFIRQGDREGRRGYRTGYQVAHEIAVSQGAQSVACLHLLEEFFGVGSVIPNRRHDNHREPMYRYVVRKRTDLLETVIPFFMQYPMRSSKQENFQKFAYCVALIDAGLHLTAPGLIEIAEVAQTMNRRKPRTELIRILRGHTPDVRDSG